MSTMRNKILEEIEKKRPKIWKFNLAESDEESVMIGMLKPLAEELKEFYRRVGELFPNTEEETEKKETDKIKLTEENLQNIDKGDDIATWVVTRFSAIPEKNEEGEYERLFSTEEETRKALSYSDRLRVYNFWSSKVNASVAEGAGKN